MLYTTDGTTGETELRNAYDRMQYGSGGGGLPENVAYPQYIQQGQTIAATVSSPSYMTAIPGTLMPVNSVNYTTANSGGGGAQFADMNSGGGGGMRAMVPLTKMPYATATLGRPPRHPGLKGSEPSICAQVSHSGVQRHDNVPRYTKQRCTRLTEDIHSLAD